MDIDITEEHLYDLYVIDCSNNGVRPSLHDYIIWTEENYPGSNYDD